MPPTNSALHGRVFHRRKKSARPTDYEKDLIAKFLKDQGLDVTPVQTEALAFLLRRPKHTVKKLLEEARTKLIGRASRMVDVHYEATEGALKKKQFAVAARNAEWYMENVSGDGQRIIDRPEAGPSGTTIQIGVQVGDEKPRTVQVPHVTAPEADVVDTTPDE